MSIAELFYKATESENWDGIKPFTIPIDTIDIGNTFEPEWDNAEYEKLISKQEFTFSVEAKVVEQIEELLCTHKFDHVFEAIKNKLNAITFVGMMKQATFGENTIVEFYPHGIDANIHIAQARGSAKTPPVVAETNIGTFVFRPKREFVEVPIGLLGYRTEECIADELADIMMPPVEDLSDPEKMKKKIKSLEKRLKYEKHPLQQKKIRSELDSLRKSVKYAKKTQKIK